MPDLTIRRFSDVDALVSAAAEDVASRVARDVEARGRCRLAFAGGVTPRPVYERLAEPALASAIDWPRVELFWGDERCVPPDHPDSNYRLVDEALLRHVPVPAGNVHRIRGELPAGEAAREYAALLGDEPLDVVMLGMGDDGHTASLFPGRPEADEREQRVVPAAGPKPPLQRVSLTLRAINEARAVVFWVTGESKADRVAEVFREMESGEPRLPAARVQPRAGELVWFLDAGAASKL